MFSTGFEPWISGVGNPDKMANKPKLEMFKNHRSLASHLPWGENTDK